MVAQKPPRWEEIQQKLQVGLKVVRIARDLGVHRNTIHADIRAMKRAGVIK